MVRALVVAVALVALALLPCAVALAITHADEVAERVYRAMRRGFRRLRARLANHRGTRGQVAPLPAGPPIEQIAADLRRLGRQRLGIATRSAVWFAAVQRAYDERLAQASRSLGVSEHLAGLEGLDRDIERVRVEGELQAAGMLLGSVDADRRQDHC